MKEIEVRAWSLKQSTSSQVRNGFPQLKLKTPTFAPGASYLKERFHFRIFLLLEPSMTTVNLAIFLCYRQARRTPFVMTPLSKISASNCPIFSNKFPSLAGLQM